MSTAMSTHDNDDEAGAGLMPLGAGRADRPPARRAPKTAGIDARAAALEPECTALEAAHRDPDAATGTAPGQPACRIELF